MIYTLRSLLLRSLNVPLPPQKKISWAKCVARIGSKEMHIESDLGVFKVKATWKT